MKASRHLLIGVGVSLVLALAVGLASASDTAPTEEPETSPFFEATLQQAVNELDGKVKPSNAVQVRQTQPTQHYTTDSNLWPECQWNRHGLGTCLVSSETAHSRLNPRHSQSMGI
jgi:hypothetical protein